MFGKQITLFTLFGFKVRIDASWIIIATLIVWSLSTGYFPFHHPSLSPRSYWLMGTAGALGLFLSIIFHEFSHSFVAQRFGLPMKGITLFIFGGVAEMGDEPPGPKAEFLMSVVGPISSFLLAAVFHGISNIGELQQWPIEVQGILSYLAFINVLLGAFNLLPAFPLDGGRILRSILWRTRRNLRWATRVASRIGAGFGLVLIIMAFFTIVMGNFIGGIWLLLIGMFLRNAAVMSYQQLLLRRSLEGEPVRRFMKTAPVTVSPLLSIQEFVEDYLYRYHYKMFPVVRGEQLLGCITTAEAKSLPKEKWASTTVGEVAAAACARNAISPETDTVQALAIMNRNSFSRLLVVDGARLVGIVTLKDLLRFFALKVELEEEE